MNERNFISLWIQTLNAESIKSFPGDFAIESECKIYTLPGKGFLIGKEFFGEMELIDAEGSEVLRADSYEKAKFIIYANRNKPDVVSILLNHSAIKQMDSKYELYLDSITKRIDQDYRKSFLGSKNFTKIINQIFNHLNLIRLK